jgi:SAM-dependent methyltransferase
MILPHYKIPADNATVDLVILFSVFTHMLRDDLRFYLSEFRRILRPAGRVYATVFLLDDEILTKQDPQSAAARIFGQQDKLRADRSKGRETWA